MDRKKFAVIKYDHDERRSLTGARWIWFVCILGAACGLLFVLVPLSLFFERVALLFLFIPPGLILGCVALLIAQQPKELYVGPRYLICGKEIVYYANVQKVIMETRRGHLLLISSNGRVLLLEQDRFQTNARKLDKIEARRAERFQKVVQKVVRHVRRASPDAKLLGVEDLPAT